MAYNYGPPRVDFSPLAQLADPIINALEERKQAELFGDYMKSQLGGQSLTALAPTPATPAAAAPSFSGGQRAMAMPADPEIERIALERAKQHVGGNPYALAAFAAHGAGESGWSPGNIVGAWADPSQSGKPGTSGGALSWRNERYANMKAKTAAAGSDPRAAVAAQTDFAFSEDPTLTEKLKNAKSLPEAFSTLAASQRYAGWNDPNSAENTKRLQLAQGYLQRFGTGGAPAPQAGAPAQAAPAAAAGISPEKQAQLQRMYAAGGQARAFAVNEIARLTTTQPKPTDIQEYEYARAQGFPGTLLDFQTAQRKAGATTVNVGPNGEAFGSPEAGLVWKRTPDGKVALDDRGAPIAIPYQGGKVFKSEQEKTAETKASQEIKARTGDIVAEEIDRGFRLIDTAVIPTTGLFGSKAAEIPGTAAHDLKNLLTTVKANAAFDKLQAMREASPTGGALGNVSNAENKKLESAIGSLEQSQTKAQLKFNMKRVKNTYLDIVHGAGKGPPRTPPDIGEVWDGYRFKGGNPANPDSWVKPK
jgi:hypothetical protein